MNLQIVTDSPNAGFPGGGLESPEHVTPERMETLSYDELRSLAKTAFREGRVEEALGLFDQALDAARAEGDALRVDRAVCNRAAVRVILGETLEVVPELRTILNHHADAENSRLAAYSLSLAYEQQKDFKKGIFYARVALNYSRLLQRNKWILSSLNQLGNCLMGESLFDDAVACYREALDLIGDQRDFHHWAVLENLGYARVVLGSPKEGLGMLLASLRGLRREGAFENVMVAHLDLSYAYLEIGRPRYALKHAAASLALADRYGYTDVQRNALYLLGQSSQECGSSAEAAEYFHRLQQKFFPSSPAVSQFLMAVDVRGMINLRA